MKKMIQGSLTLLLAIVLFPISGLQAQNWTSDPIHSSVNFRVRHVATPMLGRFSDFNVQMVWDGEDTENASVKATLDPASVDIGFAELDGHLQTKDFFHVKKHKEWSFESTEISQLEDGSYVATGPLTLRGKTKEIKIPFEFRGSVDTKRGTKAGFVAEFAIDRTEYGIKYDPEGKGIGKEITIMIFLEMNAAKD